MGKSPILNSCALSGQFFTALGAAASEHFTSGNGCFARAETVAALAFQPARLISAFHRSLSRILVSHKGRGKERGK